MKDDLPWFDELDSEPLKELIQSGSGKKTRKNSAKKTKKFPLKEKILIEKSQQDAEKREAFFRD